jgi:hypothetical protein
MPAPNKYTVAGRLSVLESRCTALEQENSQLRAHLVGALQTAINDAANTIQSSQKSDFRELQASIRIPQDGAPGRDGVDGAVGPKGEAGDVLIVGESELAQAVTALRIKIKQQHAKFIAVLLEHAQGQAKGNPYPGQHWARLLDNIRQEIERLK